MKYATECCSWFQHPTKRNANALAGTCISAIILNYTFKTASMKACVVGLFYSCIWESGPNPHMMCWVCEDVLGGFARIDPRSFCTNLTDGAIWNDRCFAHNLTEMLLFLKVIKTKAISSQNSWSFSIKPSTLNPFHLVSFYLSVNNPLPYSPEALVMPKISSIYFCNNKKKPNISACVTDNGILQSFVFAFHGTSKTDGIFTNDCTAAHNISNTHDIVDRK